MPWGILSGRKAKPVGDPVPEEYGVDTWRGWPYGTAPQEQIGIYGAQLLSQYPAYYNQPQLHSGPEWLSSHWFTPTAGTLPYWTQTTRPQNVPGGQRWGAPYSGPVGPISAQANQSRVAQAQLAQSGARALGWAQSLIGTGS